MPKTKKSLLLSAALPQKDLVLVGGRWNGTRLVAHWSELKPKLEAHRAAFDALGFTPAWESQLDALCDEIVSLVDDRQKLTEDAFPTADALNDVVARAKDFRRLAATMIGVSPKLAGRMPSIAAGGSVDGLAKSIRKMLPLLSHKDLAAPGGAAKKKEGGALLGELVKQLSAHKKAAGKIAGGVRAVNEKEGILYEELKRLSRGARLVAPELSALFSLAKHVRRRLPTRDSKSTDGAGAAPGAAGVVKG